MRKAQIYFADFETATKESEYFKKYKDTRVILWVCKNYFGKFESCGTNIKTFLDYFKDTKKNVKKYICYFHNLNWDGDFILKWLAKNNFKAQNSKEYDKNTSINSFCFLRQGRQIYQIKLRILNNNEVPIQITFLCSYKILSSGVEDLGKALGIAKHNEETLDVNFYNQEPRNNVNEYPKAFVEYAKRDVEIVRQAYINFRNNLDKLIKEKWFLRNINLEKKFTIGAISYELQRQYVYNFTLEMAKENGYSFFDKHLMEGPFEGFKIDYKSHELASKFYFGGLTQFNPKFQNKKLECESGKGFDVNSMYPSVMVKPLPYGNMQNFNDVKPYGGYLEYWELEIDSAVSYKGNFLCLINWNKLNNEGTFTKNRYVASMFNFRCFYLKEEFEALKKFYKFEGVKIVNRWWTKCASYLEDYVRDLYFYKEDYSKKGEKANAHTYKIALNSSYGKHATRSDFNELFVCKDKKEYEFLLEKVSTLIDNKNVEFSEASKTVRLDNHHILSFKNLDVKTGNEYHNKLCAATITAYARMKLYEAVYSMGCENFIYCDTDSIYVKNCENEKTLALDNYELGYWDIQDTYKYFIVKGAKAYCYGNDENFEKEYKARLSGINKNWLAKNFDYTIFMENELTLELANLKVVQCPSGLILEWKDYQSKIRLN